MKPVWWKTVPSQSIAGIEGYTDFPYTNPCPKIKKPRLHSSGRLVEVRTKPGQKTANSRVFQVAHTV